MTNTKELSVVGIGASAGGLDAVQQLFDFIPANSGMAFVIVQHLSPDFKSLMPELLAKHTNMKIYTAKDKQVLEPNSIYLNERSKNLQLKGNRLHLLDKAPKGNLNLPIDIFFHTLGEEYKENSFGIILSGTGSDGSQGIKTIKEAGGTVIIQNPSSAQFDGMPNSAISTNLADFILNPKDIAEKIIQLNSKKLDLISETSNSGTYEQIFTSIIDVIYKYSGVNFKKYKNNTLLRRLEKRMSVHNFETLIDYYGFIKNSNNEKAIIYQEFLIGVTSFFRDPEAFEIVRKKTIPALINLNDKPRTIRIWVSGCSTGEEVYSLAILFDEYIRTHKLSFDFKIFATDIDKKALQIAGLGSYSVNNIVEIESKYLDEYFFKTGDRIQIVKRIREKVVFSFHDVTKDPPFIRMDLISCRNLLIYFNNNTQKKVLNNFQYALNKSGHLFLGSSESLGVASKYFEVIDGKWKIYSNLAENTRIRSEEDFENEPLVGLEYLKDKYNTRLRDSTIQNLQETVFYKYLSKKHSPTSVFVDKNYDILFFLGNLKQWISFSDGLFQNNLLKNTETEIATIIRNGVRRVNKEKKNVIFKNLVLKSGKDIRKFDISFEKVEDFGEISEAYLIEFGDVIVSTSTKNVVVADKDLPNFSKQRIDDLELELKENKYELQNVVEELETSNEELQSSNEELMSSNEELQSSNEELQSVNEELYTVNTELQEKNKELENLNNDILNLLNSSDVGTLFLDTDLNIRKFTPVITRIFNLEHSDIGRSIISFASEFEESVRKLIIANSKRSLEELKSFEKEIKDNLGNWFLIRINPFITSSKKIDGVVITFVEINSIKNVQEELKDSNLRLDKALKSGNMAWWEVHLPEKRVVFSPGKAGMLGRKTEDFKLHKDFTRLIHPDDHDYAMNAFNNHISGKEEKYDCQYRIKNQNGEYKWLHEVGKVSQTNGEKKVVTGIVSEITHKKESELELIMAKKKAEIANIYKNQFLANMSHEIRTPMNGLVGFASLLREPNLSSKTKNKYIDIIENSSNQLLNLINDIIDVSKIEAKELKIENRSCKLIKLFNDTETTFNEIKRKKKKDHIKIETIIPEKDKGLELVTDPERLQQILTNLVSNALKFTDDGIIEFGYKTIKDNVFIYVRDTGIGIPKEKINIIFERFEQVNKNEVQTVEGTGLGLSISKGLVNLLGGNLQVESEVSKGSTFSFEIPRVAGNKENGKTEDQIKLDEIDLLFKDKTVLIAEDEPVNIEYYKALFASSPLNIIFAENGLEALNIVSSKQEIDIILMDLRMPVMDGFEAARKILKKKPESKIIAQTAYAMAGDKIECLKSGFIDYMSKPLKKEEFLMKIASWIRN